MFISTKKLLLKNDRFSLSGEVIQGKLSLELEIFAKNMFTGNQEVTKRFSKLVLLGHRDDLRTYFNNVQSLVQHLKKQENFKVDIKRGILTLKQGKIRIELDEKEIIGVSDFYYDSDNRLKEEHTEPQLTKDISQERIKDTSIYSFQKSDENRGKEKHRSRQREPKTDPKRDKINGSEVTKKLVEFQIKYKMLEQQVKSSRQFFHQCMKRIQNLQRQILLSNTNHLASNYLLPHPNFIPDPEEGRFIGYQATNYEKQHTRQKRKKQVVKKEPSPQRQNSMEMESNQSESSSNHQWIDYNTYSMKYINIQANRISSATENRVAVFAEKNVEDKNEIKMQIVKKKGVIGLGICNSAYKNSPQIVEKPELILLQSSGEVRCLGKYQKDEKGIWVAQRGQENIISMRVDIEGQKIEWKIDKRLILAIQSCHILKQKARQWSMFVFLQGKDDSIDIIY